MLENHREEDWRIWKNLKELERTCKNMEEYSILLEYRSRSNGRQVDAPEASGRQSSVKMNSFDNFESRKSAEFPGRSFCWMAVCENSFENHLGIIGIIRFHSNLFGKAFTSLPSTCVVYHFFYESTKNIYSKKASSLFCLILNFWTILNNFFGSLLKKE